MNLYTKVPYRVNPNVPYNCIAHVVAPAHAVVDIA